MDPIALISSIVSLVGQLKSIYHDVQANKSQCATLIARLDAILPHLLQLKEAEMKSKHAHDDPAQVAARKQQLEAMLTCAEDAYELASKFTTAHWVKRLLKRSDYTEEFAALNARLTTCQSDLHFGLAATALFAADRDAADARADLADINAKSDLILEEIRRVAEDDESRYQSERRWRRNMDEQQKRIVSQMAKMHLERVAQLYNLQSRLARQRRLSSCKFHAAT
jgi:hypothetical protein